MNSIAKKISIIAVMICLIVAFMPALGGSAHAASVKLNKKTVYLAKGKTVKLKVKGTKAKVKWSSSNKKIATVSKSGKVKGKKVGKCTITAKVKGKKLKCKVYVETKAANQARKLRNYVLKKGKYNKETKEYCITRQFTDPENEEAVHTAEIYAKKDSKKLIFDWNSVSSTPAEGRSFSMTIDLISNKSVKTGSYRAYYEDNYSTETWDEYVGKITTKFDGSEAGVSISKYVECIEGTETTYPNAGDSKEHTRSACARASRAFEDFVPLLKKAGVSWKSIGFSKWAPRQ